MKFEKDNVHLCTIVVDIKALEEMKKGLKAEGVTMRFHVMLRGGNLVDGTGSGPGTILGSLQSQPEGPQVSAHTQPSKPEVQHQLEELF